ncbi:hypothetical protein FHR92_003487 [Fontibacillus solani]|uniref:Helicase XPB/Ssl2 N-terminal domain-containing protein n=1 Tax=Fontibacillus solani TaxID=1572857 RepID=A0A7W3SVL1_9BACL|nr:helicase-associated domain-containing protein [Fontibacillus solani]MBA9087007.1 hypothetical protein [Fontibacillus solani]
MIQHIFTRFAGLPFKLQNLQDSSFGAICGADLLAEVPELLRSGRLASIKKVWGERLYYIPADVIPLVWKELEPTEQVQQDEHRVTLHRAAKLGLAFDIFKTLAWIGRHGLKLTSKGTIHQRSLGKLNELLFLSDDDVNGLALRYPHQDAYRAPLAIVLDMIMSLGLINKERAGWSLNTESLTAWLGLTAQEMNAVLFRELLLRYAPDNVPIQHFVHRLILPDLEVGSWYNLPDLLLSMHEQGMMPEVLSQEQISWMESWLTALSGFGWMDMGTTIEDRVVFRWQTKPDLSLVNIAEEISSSKVEVSSAFQGMIFVQPDFELLVPPDVSFLLRWELEAFCENITVDTMSLYRLTRNSVALGAECGRSPEMILNLLQKCSSGVPDNVRLALEQWGREMGRTLLEEKLLLRCSDSQAADTISSITSLVGIIERIGPLDFIVSNDHEDKVRKALEEIRLSPPKRRTEGLDESEYPVLEPSQLAEGVTAFTQASNQQGWIFNGKDTHFYEPDTTILDFEALFPGLRDIPPMWVKEMRKYHDSTARKIVEQAIQWRAKIKLSIGGEIMLCIPEGIQGGEKWSLSGRLFRDTDDYKEGEGVVLSPDDWAELGLVLPEM